jgi:uncharacterized protein
VKSVEATQPNSKNQPRYIVDSMFGNVARKLRILGFDTFYSSSLRDDDVIRMGLEQSRTVITGDKELFFRSVNKKISAVLLRSTSDLQNIGNILKSHSVTLKFNQSLARCANCNGVLTKSPKEKIKERVKDKVFNAYEIFYVCKDCSNVYWIGTHVTEIECWIKKLNDVISSNYSLAAVKGECTENS